MDNDVDLERLTGEKTHTIPIDKKLRTGPSTSDIGCTQASVSATIKDDDIILATSLLRSFAGIKLAASEIKSADVDLTLKFRLKEVAIAEVDGVTNPSQTVGKASSVVAIIHDSLLFEVVIFVKW